MADVKKIDPVAEWFAGLSVHLSPRPQVHIMACDKCGVGIYTDNSQIYHYLGKCVDSPRPDPPPDQVEASEVEAWFAGLPTINEYGQRRCDKCLALSPGVGIAKLQAWQPLHFAGKCIAPEPVPPGDCECHRWPYSSEMVQMGYGPNDHRPNCDGLVNDKLDVKTNITPEKRAEYEEMYGRMVGRAEPEAVEQKYQSQYASIFSGPGFKDGLKQGLADFAPDADKVAEAGVDDLSLLVIDLGGELVTKFETGDLSGLDSILGLRFGQLFFNDGCSFTGLRDAIDKHFDQLESEKPVPRIESFSKVDGLAKHDWYRVIWNEQGNELCELSQPEMFAINELAGHPLPVWTPKRGEWRRLPLLGEADRISIWRYTR